MIEKARKRPENSGLWEIQNSKQDFWRILSIWFKDTNWEMGER